MPLDAVSYAFCGIHEDTLLVLAADGTGILFDTANGWRPTDYFSHEADVMALKSLPDDERSDAIRDFFAEHVNPNFADPLFLDGTPPTNSTHFPCGSREELETLARLIIQSDPSFAACRDAAIVSFDGLMEEDEEASNIDALRTWSLTGLEPTPRIEALMQIAEEINEFHGTVYFYNDSDPRRTSGCTTERACINVTVEPTSGHEAIAALEDLKSALAKHGISYDDVVTDLNTNWAHDG